MFVYVKINEYYYCQQHRLSYRRYHFEENATFYDLKKYISKQYFIARHHVSFKVLSKQRDKWDDMKIIYYLGNNWIDYRDESNEKKREEIRFYVNNNQDEKNFRTYHYRDLIVKQVLKRKKIVFILIIIWLI